MKLKLTTLAFVLGTGLASAQGTFVFDQQSPDSPDGSASLTQTPFGQSFTPTLDSVGFVELQLFDGNSASTVAVNVRSGSITGSILGTSQSATVPSASSGIFDFLFSNPVTLTPGTQYFFEPVIVSGGFAGADLVTLPYAGGNAIISGTQSADNLWFREGIVVPEPSAAGLFALVGAILYWHRRKRRIA